jgi:phosphoglycolate phosphatase-like HAD superfamily hydrolase
MIRLCLFDLDQTLVDTHDIEALRLAGVHRTDDVYPAEVQRAFTATDRSIIDEAFLLALRQQFPDMKLGVLTRSPRRYADTVLQHVFPNVQWDTVISYEDVQLRKPHRQGVYRAMWNVGMPNVSDLPDVLLVGDSDVDIRAAYHAGCSAVLFKKGWPYHYESTHWRSMGLLPDGVATNEDDLLAAISDPIPKLPDLECLLADKLQAPLQPRFDKIGKFFPNDRTRHVVYTAGRSFAGYETLNQRREWHDLSQSIQDNKDSENFPEEWIESIKRFIAYHYHSLGTFPFGDGPELVITAIPARPERIHRLGYLIEQLRSSYGDNPRLKRLRLTFDPNLLAYKSGVRSQSREHLNPEERFANVRDHLYVVNPGAARDRRFLVIDDVTTTGATLLYAEQYLMDAGATSIDCFSFTQNISDPLR